MEEFIELSKKNTPYKVYKRKYKWSPEDVLYNVRLVPYYQKFLEVRKKTLALHLESKNAALGPEKLKCINAIKNYKIESRQILGGIKNECTRN